MKGEETPHGKRAEKEVRFEKGVDGSLGHIIQGHIGHVRRKRSWVLPSVGASLEPQAEG